MHGTGLPRHTGRGDFRGGAHGDEAAVLALLADDDVEVDDIFAIAFEIFF